MKSTPKIGQLKTRLLLSAIMGLLLVSGAAAQSKFRTLHHFKRDVADGGGPWAGLTFDQAGNLYGTTTVGGVYNHGTVFKLAPNRDGRWMESVLYNFPGGNEGDGPYGGLIFDDAGNLYGTTTIGGQRNNGTVFKLTASGDWTESVLYSFTGYNDGGVPWAGLIFDQAGNLYGTTFWDGTNGVGTVFMLTPGVNGSWTERVLYSFRDLGDGSYPSGSLVLDQAGNLYGTTTSGGLLRCGDFECGVVFKLAPNRDGSWAETVIHSFAYSDGFYPAAGLIFDVKGNLYGTTANGGDIYECDGDGCGVAFRLTPKRDGSWVETVLHVFRQKSGGVPGSSLIFDAAGNLYGTTSRYGRYGYGSVFKLTPSSHGEWKQTVLHSFSHRSESHPIAGLASDAAGNLYGTTYGDGKAAFGSVFQVKP